MNKSSIKDIRLSLKLSQQELAEMLNLTRASISNYELSKRYPRPDIALKLVEIARSKGVHASLDDIYVK